MTNLLNLYRDFNEEIEALNYALWVISWDGATQTPRNAFPYRSEQIGILAKKKLMIQTSNEYINTIKELYERRDELADLLSREIVIEYKNIQKYIKVPKKELLEYEILLSDSEVIWAEAREKEDFDIFLPTLEKIIKFNQNLTKYLETDTLKGYDVLLDMYEEGFNQKKYDKFFELLKEQLVPFVLNATKQKSPSFRKITNKEYDPYLQHQFSKYLLKTFNFDESRGTLSTSNHPFTSSINKTDVRITSKFKPKLLVSGIFSTIHELGHGLYEQNIGDDIAFTKLGSGCSLGIHESQSRMYENMIGRSYAFWEEHYPELQKIFNKELRNVSVLEFHRFINTTKRSLIRTEADELTYSLHIIVRYELEKQLITGKIKAKDLPRRWRTAMQKYVGTRPTNLSDGVLQDIHWAAGLFGYFPTYALGSAYAAQIYYYMNREINVDNCVENNQMYKINDWLKENVHKFGKTMKPEEILRNATGKEFDPNYYINYLKRKYSY